MKVLVTGGLGYVGRNLVERLLSEHKDVVVVDNLSNSGMYNKVESAKYKLIHTKDLREEDFDNVDIVYHLAEYSRIAPSFEEIDKVFDLNILGSFHVLELCRKKQVPLVYAASSTRLCEEGENHSPYSFFKSTIAKLVKNYGKWYGLNYSICYFFNVYGNHSTLPKSKWNNVVSLFEKNSIHGKPLTICGDGLQERDFTHVNDIVEGLILAGNKLENEEYQFGTGEKFTIRELANMFGGEVEYVEARPGDRKTSIADVDSTKNSLGWKAKVHLPDYIKVFKELAKVGSSLIG